MPKNVRQIKPSKPAQTEVAQAAQEVYREPVVDCDLVVVDQADEVTKAELDAEDEEETQSVADLLKSHEGKAARLPKRKSNVQKKNDDSEDGGNEQGE